jgi:sigma-B regulation protein RsbU (phosphoserine phosphatase)
LQLSAGDRLFLYTDGIIEHENSAEELFGQQRFAEVLQGQQQQGLDAQCKAVIDALNTFGEGMPFRDAYREVGKKFS